MGTFLHFNFARIKYEKMFGTLIFMPISFFAKIDATRFVIFTYKEGRVQNK